MKNSIPSNQSSFSTTYVESASLTQQRFWKILLPTLASGLMMLATPAKAIVLDFTEASSTVYADNFTQVSSGTFFTQENGYVQGKQNSTFWGASLYTTGLSDFTAETVTMNATITGTLTNSPVLELFSRVDNNIGFRARIYFLEDNKINLQLAYGLDLTTRTGSTLLLNWTYNVSTGVESYGGSAENTSGGSGTTGHTISAGTSYQFVLESNLDNEFQLSLLDTNGVLYAKTGFQTSLGLKSSVAEYGKVGLGGAASNSAGNTLQFYKFSVIPEPTTWVLLLGGLGILGFRFRNHG